MKIGRGVEGNTPYGGGTNENPGEECRAIDNRPYESEERAKMRRKVGGLDSFPTKDYNNMKIQKARMIAMLLAPKLKKGDTIAVFSPSTPATATAPKRYARAKAFLEDKGFRIIEGSLTGKRDFYRSGTIAERAEEFNELIRNPEVKCIISAIGGTVSNSMLPYLDYEQLRKTPKIIMGYSDVTALLLGIYAQTGLVTYYGPAVVASFGEFPPYSDMAFDYFWSVVSGEAAAPYTLPTPEFWSDEMIFWERQDRSKTQMPNELVTVSGGQAQGRVIGGNLNTMSGIWGSPYIPEIRQGDILLIEDCMKEVATIERSFSMLKLNGIFDRIGGLILGKHELFKDMDTDRKPYEVLLEVLGGVPEFPLLAEFDCCHTHPMLTMPLGTEVLLDATAQTVTPLRPWIG